MRNILLYTIFLLLFSKLTAQTTLQGRVTIANTNEAAIGASVSVLGTKIGTVTNLDGQYKIEIPTKQATLVVSYTGFEKQEILVAGRSTIDVGLVESFSTLDEVIVTGYSNEKRSNISGSVSTIGSAEIGEKPILRVEQALQGRTAGVQVAQTSGSPGAPLTVRVRGIGTINSSDPLYIVDGVAVGGLDFLNTNDIETISILKDAASAAIYGSRGANGVVLITTKTGKLNQAGKIGYESYYGVQQPMRYMELLNATEYATLQNEAYIAGGKTPLPEFANPASLGKGTDWQEAIFQPAPIASHQLSFTGGGTTSTYNVSANYFNQEGIVGGSKSQFKRGTVRFNNSNQLKPWLTLGNQIGFTWLQRSALIENNQNTSPLVRALNMDPITPIKKADGTYAYSNYTSTDITNPVNAIEQTYGNWTSNRVVGNVYAEVRPLPRVVVRSAASVDVTFAVERGFSPIFDLSNIASISEAPTEEKRKVNTVSVANHQWRNIQWENTATYTPYLGEKHHMNTIMGTSILTRHRETSGGANTNLPSNRWEDAWLANTIDPISAQSAYQWATASNMRSYFAKANYDFDNTYLFTATMRADGSSRFGRNNRFGYFPSFSAGYILSHTDYWHLDAINFFKVRASWGSNGNEEISDYGYTSVVNNGQNYTFGSDETITNGAVSLTAANPDLKWETSTQTNVGVDAEILKGRATFTADYYIKKTSDMLFAAPIPLVAGTAPPIQNVATALNSGVELAAQWRNFDHAFTYALGANITFIKSKVTGLGRGGEPVLSGYIQSANSQATKTDVGYPAASFFGFVTDGIFQTQAEVEAAAFQNAQTAPGDIRFKDLDGNGVIDQNDRTYIGNPTPEISYGFNTDFGWKGFEFNLFWQGTQGNDIFQGFTRSDFNFVNRSAETLGRWTGPGTSNTQPRVSLSDPNQNVRVSDRFVQDGSYLRLKNVQFAYNLPQSYLKKLRFSKVKCYVSGQNLLTFTKYNGLDPEIGQVGSTFELGIDRGFYPQARTVMVGVSIGL
jgi:TonB-dependent starch-binding outer membrane protein SusC